MAVLEQMTPRHYQQLRLSLMDTSESVDLGVRAVLLCVSSRLKRVQSLSFYHLRALSNYCIFLQEFILCTFNAFSELAALNLYANVWTVLKLQLN